MFTHNMWELKRQVLEIRYDDGFVLWDKAGWLARQVISQFPDLIVESGTPAEVKFIGQKKSVSLTLGLNRLNLNCDLKFASQSYFHEVGTWVVELVVTELKIALLKRIGHRIMYDLIVDSREKAKSVVDGLVRRTCGVHQLLDTDDVRLKAKGVEELAIRFADENTGILVSLKSTVNRFGLEMPGASSWASVLPQPQHAATLDVDVYTTQPTEPNMLNVEALMRSNIKMVETRLLHRITK